MVSLPARYQAERTLGKGGGGEVWAVVDRLSGKHAALKVLARDAGPEEGLALVREATALSGLEGLGLPRVLAFGKTPTGETYMVRELIEGRSLLDVLEGAKGDVFTWIDAWLGALNQLTAIHRAGLLHGDIKPANMIVTTEGRGLWVDLGLAAPFKGKGAQARGLTPMFAAPELVLGEPLTVRCEVYSAGASMKAALDAKGAGLQADVRSALDAIAARATDRDPSSRYPSIDEFATSVRGALHKGTARVAPALPVVGLEGPAAALTERTLGLRSGGLLALTGPSLSGRSTLLRRLAWTLSLSNVSTVHLEPASFAITNSEAVRIGLADCTESTILLVDDWHVLDNAARAQLHDARARGMRMVVTGDENVGSSVRSDDTFAVPALAPHDAALLARICFPSLPDALIATLLEHTASRPGALRNALHALDGKPVASRADIEHALSNHPAATVETVTHVWQLIERGHFGEANAALDRLMPEAKSEAQKVQVALARVRIHVAQGNALLAEEVLAQVKTPALKLEPGLYHLSDARIHVRKGAYEAAVACIAHLDVGETSPLVSEGLCLRGMAEAFLGRDAEANQTLARALEIAEALAHPRASSIAWGSRAIVEQRRGRYGEAKRAYEKALTFAEAAEDAWSIAIARLNLGTLARTAGDIASALSHFEAAVDMGERAGATLCVEQARLNAANLDLYLGRYAHADAILGQLRTSPLAPAAEAQLLGLEAEYHEKTGNAERAIEQYTASAKAYEALGRTEDAFECQLEALLLHATRLKPDQVPALAETLAKLWTPEQSSDHSALAWLARATFEAQLGHEQEALSAVDTAVNTARKTQSNAVLFRALELRTTLQSALGSTQLARRDTEEALGLCEEAASKLPRDLREVFWNDPKRKKLREAHKEPGLNQESLMRTQTSSSGIDERFRRIFDITRELAREHTLAAVLERVTDHAIAIVGAERGFIVLVNEEGQIETQTARGPKGATEEQRFSRSIAEEVLRTGEPVIAKSALDDARLREAVSVHQLMIQSVACIPIRSISIRQEAIGALYLETRLKRGHLFQQELPMLLAFADQAAIAIENARLLEQNISRTRELERSNSELEATRARLAEALEIKKEQLSETRRDLRKVRSEIKSHFGYGGLVGTSDAMRRVYSIIDRVKDTDVPVLLLGESGAGKEVVAKAIHQASARAKGPFLGLNCGAIPKNLLESELFGHVKGSFTGADRDHKGMFRQTEGGTILLDEIGELPLDMQAALLRVLQEKCVRPIGAHAEEPVNVRIVAATNKNLGEMARQGTFREDLFYRLDVVGIAVPPLRSRRDDIPLLVDHFLRIFASRYERERKAVSREAQMVLSSYDWPGNVRQLEHVLLNAWLMSEGDEITAADLPLTTSELARKKNDTAPLRSLPPAGKGDKARILQALEDAQWNRVLAAKNLGMPRRTFYRRLKEYKIV